MINLQFHDLRDKAPEARIPINFFVIKQPLMLSHGGLCPGSEMYRGMTTYHWMGYSVDGEFTGESICYDYEDKRQNSICTGGELPTEETDVRYIKTMELDRGNSPVEILPFKSTNAHDDEDIEIAWEYEHVVYYNLSKQAGFAKSAFPVEFLEMLMKDSLIELVKVVNVDSVYCNRDNFMGKWFTAIFNWQGVLWEIKGTNNYEWPDDAWIDGKYHNLSIYSTEVV